LIRPGLGSRRTAAHLQYHDVAGGCFEVLTSLNVLVCLDVLVAPHGTIIPGLSSPGRHHPLGSAPPSGSAPPFSTAASSASYTHSPSNASASTPTGQSIQLRTDAPIIPDDPDLNRRVAQFLLCQHEITSRFVDAMMNKDTPAMNAAANELCDWKSAHAGLADDIAKIVRVEAVGPVHAHAWRGQCR
jgi:hypothetical protein